MSAVGEKGTLGQESLMVNGLGCQAKVSGHGPMGNRNGVNEVSRHKSDTMGPLFQTISLGPVWKPVLGDSHEASLLRAWKSRLHAGSAEDLDMTIHIHSLSFPSQ